MNDARILAWVLADPSRAAQLRPHQWTAVLTIAQAERLLGTLAHRLAGLDVPETAARVRAWDAARADAPGALRGAGPPPQTQDRTPRRSRPKAAALAPGPRRTGRAARAARADRAPLPAPQSADLAAVALGGPARAGIADGEVLTGADLEAFSSGELAHRLSQVSVFARIMAEQKLRIVEAFKKTSPTRSQPT